MKILVASYHGFCEYDWESHVSGVLAVGKDSKQLEERITNQTKLEHFSLGAQTKNGGKEISFSIDEEPYSGTLSVEEFEL